VSYASNPEFSANVLGIQSNDSANIVTPSLTLPDTFYLQCSIKWWWDAISKAPPPGMTDLSSIVFLTALRPSRIASLA